CVTIGRIIGINPTLIIPLLRKAVLQLLNQVKFGDIKVQERGIILLTALVVSCGQYMASYASAIIPLFLEKLRAHDQPLTLQMQSTNIGYLSICQS
ncbi:hypothetical protein M1146_00045, partial [Patescibacteria group bacterium]|nr:hypothetical protein [Patescibacteria group bacterium]